MSPRRAPDRACQRADPPGRVAPGRHLPATWPTAAAACQQAGAATTRLYADSSVQQRRPAPHVAARGRRGAGVGGELGRIGRQDAACSGSTLQQRVRAAFCGVSCGVLL
ncbi:MAG TPA: hypothetical protein VFS21_29910 [Roseiflexaceae bacterium]|nr:hypothetical protein [Roseiflexaceae bacterium]